MTTKMIKHGRIRRCEICGKTFEARTYNQRFCYDEECTKTIDTTKLNNGDQFIVQGYVFKYQKIADNFFK